MRKNTFLILFLALCIFSVVTTAQTGPNAQNPSLQPTQGSPWSPATPTGLAPQQPVRKFKSGEILIKLNSDDAGVLKNDPIIKSVYAEFGTPKVENIFKKSAKAATWDDHFEKVKQRFPTRAKRSHRKAKSKLGRYFKLSFSASDEQLAEIAKRLRKSQNIQSVAYNTMVHVNAINRDPYTTSSGTWGQTYADLWGLDKISAKKVWATGISGSYSLVKSMIDASSLLVTKSFKSPLLGSATLIMAVIDTGLDLTHADIIDNLYANSSETAGNGVDDDGNGYIDDTVGWDFFNSDNDPTDDYYHGTHVAGTIAATGNNGIGMAGVMWKAQILPVKICDANGDCPTTNIANGIMYAADQGADVINLSLGCDGSNSGIEAAVEYASSLGVVIVAAAGNDGADAMEYSPAMYDDVITVASSSSSDALSSFSNFGAKIDVAAPGEDILSLLAADGIVSSTSSSVVGTNYLRLSGTSMAAPHVSGVVGLLLAKDPTLTAEEVRQAIRQTDDIGDAGWDEDTGYGRLNALKAIEKPTKCEALITDPDNYSDITSSFTVSGYAGGASFDRYRLEVYENADGTSTLVASSPPIPIAISDGTLATLTIPTYTPGGDYSVRLTVYDSAGKVCGRDRKEVSGSYIIGSFDTDGSALNVAIDGNYAYVADGSSGLQIIDISDPVNPALIGTYDTSGSAADIKISGNYAYVADGSSGLQIIDISTPESPVPVGSYDAAEYTALVVTIDGNYAYVTDSFYDEYGLQIIDISDPVNPLLVGTLDTEGNAYDIAVDGSYAYVADGSSGLQIIDISDPVNPLLVGTLDTEGNAYGIAVDGNYAYIADYNRGLQIINISDPVNPLLVGTLDTEGAVNGIAVDGSYAYVTDYYYGLLLIIDITNPSVPFLAWTYDTPGEAYDVDVQDDLAVVADHDSGIQVISLTAPISEGVAIYVGGYDTSGLSYDIALSGNYVYVTDGSGGGFEIIDISAPENPTLVGTYDTPGGSTDIAISGNYAYVADGTSGLQIIDISTPESPTLIGTYDTNSISFSDVAISGNYAYMADSGGYSAGLQIIDISTPESPTLVGTYDTSGTAYGITISGNYAYVADGSSGLQIIDVSTPESPALIGTYDTSENTKAIAVDGDYAYVADYQGGLEIIDISSPTSPSSVANYPTTSYTTNVTILGTYAYVSDYVSGLQILDISTPSSPTLVVNYDTPGGAMETVTDGTYTYVADYYGMLVLYTRVP